MKPTLKMDHFPALRGEIRRVDAPSAEKGELCAICLTEFESQNEEAGKYNDQNGKFTEVSVEGQKGSYFPVGVLLISDYLDFASIDSILNVAYL